MLLILLSLGVAALNSPTPPASGARQDAAKSFANAAFEPSEPQPSDVIAIKEGASLDLNCSNAEQTDDMIISWTCNNKPAGIKSNRIYVTEAGRLRIKWAKVGDSCDYRCEAADGFGTWSVFTRVIVVDKQLMNKLTAGSHQNDPSAGRDKKGAPASPLKGEPATATGAAAVAAAAKLAASGANKEIILNDSAGGRGGSSGARLTVQIEPEQVTVRPNHSFSLNCKVNHSLLAAPELHDKVPQIIWLKEFMGRPPGSLEQALRQNLIYLAGGYYHTLNWPRSVSYSRASFCGNSALVIKRASFLHAGRYVCLSGYLDRPLSLPEPAPAPPSVVGPQIAEANQQARAEEPATTDADRDQVNPFEPPGIPGDAAQYVMAVAWVRLELAPGGAGSSGESDEEFYYRLRWRDNSFGEALIRLFGFGSARGWLLLLCPLCLLAGAIIITCFYKLAQARSSSSQGRAPNRKRASGAAQVGPSAKKPAPGTRANSAAAQPLVFTRDEQMKLNDSHLYNLMNRSVIINELERLTSSQLSSAAAVLPAPSNDGATYARPLARQVNPRNNQVDGEHVYSEIGDHPLVRPDPTSLSLCPDHHHSSSSCYKVPNKAPRDY